MSPGSLAIVLHAHLPYVRHPEHDEFLEEYWFYEAMLESYLPLLEVFRRLVDDRVRFRVTLNLSPTLLAMMHDGLLAARFTRRLENLLELCDKELSRGGAARAEISLARMYRTRLRRLGKLHRECRSGLPAAFAELQNLGVLELVACAATHGFLPFLAATPHAINAQIAVGVAEYRRSFGRNPSGIWLPECAYVPQLDPVLAAHGLRWFVVESHGIEHARPKPALGTHSPVLTPGGLAAFGRDPLSAKQVWSSCEGYPGDPWYREFYRDIGHSRDLRYIRPHLPAGIRFDTGLKYHRITSPGRDKKLYVRARAMDRVRLHAEHFVRGRERQLFQSPAPHPILTAPYDAELFGHWWFEGPDWLEQVLRLASKRIRTVTPSEYLADHPPLHSARLGFSSWGDRGYGDVWINPETEWIYPALHRMADSAGELARLQNPSPLVRRALNQCARELLLAEASDWPFLIRRGGAPHYAAARVRSHEANFQELERAIRGHRVSSCAVQRLEQRLCPFPDIDYRVFRAA
jgi:1,4-alpha-glucan branching enzyme